MPSSGSLILIESTVRYLGIEVDDAMDARKTELEKLQADAPQPQPVLVHPRMGDRYREQIGRLREALGNESRRAEAAEIVRGLIDAIVLRPSGTGRGRTLSIDLSGHLAGILNLARETKRGAAGAPVSDQQIKLVAGARNHLDLRLTQLLSATLQATVPRSPSAQL